MKRAGRTIRVALSSAFLGWLASSVILFAVFMVAANFDRDPRSAPYAFAFGAMITVGSIPTALVSTLTLGLLWHSHAVKRCLTRRSDYWLPGAIIGGVVGLVVPQVTFPGMDASWRAWIAIGIVYGAVCGGLTGLSAWIMLRPDRNAGNVAVATGDADVPAENLTSGNEFGAWIRMIAVGIAVVMALVVLGSALFTPR